MTEDERPETNVDDGGRRTADGHNSGGAFRRSAVSRLPSFQTRDVRERG